MSSPIKMSAQTSTNVGILLQEDDDVTPENKTKPSLGDTFDIGRVKAIGVFNDVFLFGQLDCYREDSRTGLILDGKPLRTQNKRFVSGLCRLIITVEGAVYDGELSQGMMQRQRLHLQQRKRCDDRLYNFIGYSNQMEKVNNTLYSQIAFIDCDVIFNTGVPMDEVRESITRYTIDTEGMLLNLSAVDLVERYKSFAVNACCISIARLYVHPAFRSLGLSAWMLKNLPILGQTVVNMPVGDMLLVPGDFSNEAARRKQPRSEYIEWLRGYYVRNGFKPEQSLTAKGIYRNQRLTL